LKLERVSLLPKRDLEVGAVSLDRNNVTASLGFPLESFVGLIRLCGIHSIQQWINPVIISAHISDIDLNFSDRSSDEMVLHKQRVSWDHQLDGRLLSVRVRNEESPILDLMGSLKLFAGSTDDAHDPGVLDLRFLVLIEKGRVV
jgi:hypothetical protein